MIASGMASGASGGATPRRRTPPPVRRARSTSRRALRLRNDHGGARGQRVACRCRYDAGRAPLEQQGAELPEPDGDKPARKRFKAYPIGYLHIAIAEVRTEQGKLHLFVAMDRGEIFRAHSFELACAQNHIEHRLTKPYHPWTKDEFEKSLSAFRANFLLRMGDRVAKSGAWRRKPRRAAYGRSSFAASMRARGGPLGCHPLVRRPYAASPSAA